MSLIQECKSLLTFVTSEKTGDIVTSYGEGSFTLSQVRFFGAFEFAVIIPGFPSILAAPTGNGRGQECQQERYGILQGGHQEEALKGTYRVDFRRCFNPHYVSDCRCIAEEVYTNLFEPQPDVDYIHV